MAQIQFMRRLKVPVPEEAKSIVRNADFLRFGIIYERPVKGGPYFGTIQVYTVHKNGGEPNWAFPLVAEMSFTTSDASNYALKARALAASPHELSILLTQTETRK